MNLNEECLLQFLKNEGASTPYGSQPKIAPESGLTLNLGRILRRDRFVSFPAGIVVRRDHTDLSRL